MTEVASAPNSPVVPVPPLTQRFKQKALELGFDKIGIVPASLLETEHERLVMWLDRGYQGEMGWMARSPATRTDPAQIFPAARSVIVVAVNYYTPEQHRASEATGKVSRYAWGDDYHDVVGQKLRQLLDWLKQEEPAADGKVCVDIQPIMDKAWAVRAGLGWLGKHSNVITPELGSWVFLGELLVNIELEYDRDVIPDHCGSCTLCLDACPTGAIVEPYVVDSNRCISYATIELRSPEIPAPVANNLDGWIYGCDVCQDVCPWNRFAEVTQEDRFRPRPGMIDLALAEVSELDPGSYAERFRGSAMKRAKLSGLQRNARALAAQETVKACA